MALIINYPVEEGVDDEGSELQLSTASELSEKSEVESRISQESMDDHEVSDQESDVVEIGKPIFQFKLSSLDGDHLKVS